MDGKPMPADQMKAQDSPKHRRVDQTDMEARAAIASTMRRFGPWRYKLAMLAAATAHRSADRASLLEHCKGIRRELDEARSEMVAALSEAPARITNHSRVNDVAKALDDVEARLVAVRRELD